jgi:hypothetical protein
MRPSTRLWVGAALLLLAPDCKKVKTIERDLRAAQGVDEVAGGEACPYAPGSEVRIAYTMSADKGPPTTVERTYTIPKDARTNLGPDGKSYSAKLDSFPVEFTTSGIHIDFTPSVFVDNYERSDCSLTLGSSVGNRTEIATSGAPELPPFTNLDWKATVSAHGATATASFGDTGNVSCMDERTPIRMADGTDVEIRDLVVGDRLLDPWTGATVRVARIIRGPERRRPTIAISTGQGTVVFSEGHAIPTAAGLKAARDIAASDELRGPSRSAWAITRLAVLPPSETEVVYNVELAVDSERIEDHVLLAGGIVVGDWWMQERLRKGGGEARLGSP